MCHLFAVSPCHCLPLSSPLHNHVPSSCLYIRCLFLVLYSTLSTKGGNQAHFLVSCAFIRFLGLQPCILSLVFVFVLPLFLDSCHKDSYVCNDSIHMLGFSGSWPHVLSCYCFLTLLLQEFLCPGFSGLRPHAGLTFYLTIVSWLSQVAPVLFLFLLISNSQTSSLQVIYVM